MKRDFKIKDVSYLKRIEYLSKKYAVEPTNSGAHKLKKTHRFHFHLKSEKPIWFDLPVTVKTSILSDNIVRYQVNVSLRKMIVVWTITIMICGLVGCFLNFLSLLIILSVMWLVGLIIVQFQGGRLMDKLEEEIKHPKN